MAARIPVIAFRGSLLADHALARRSRGLLARDVRLNRDSVSPEHSMASAPVKVRDLALTHGRPLPWGTIALSPRYATVDADGQTVVDAGPRGSVTWCYSLR
jgi:hypothetical protein